LGGSSGWGSGGIDQRASHLYESVCCLPALCPDPHASPHCSRKLVDAGLGKFAS
jgi:hypothetical protein